MALSVENAREHRTLRRVVRHIERAPDRNPLFAAEVDILVEFHRAVLGPGGEVAAGVDRVAEGLEVVGAVDADCRRLVRRTASREDIVVLDDGLAVAVGIQG